MVSKIKIHALHNKIYFEIEKANSKWEMNLKQFKK